MTETTLTQFIDKLIEEKIFLCSLCDNLLTLPIVLVENLGNICRDCTVQKSHIGIQNFKLESILEQLTLPCKFRITGCNERILFPNLKLHENVCKYHEKPCLLSNEGCKWKGVQNNVSTHFMENHVEHVLTSQSHLFTITIHLNVPVNVTKLLKGKYEFILKIKMDDKDNLLYTICDVKNPCTNYNCLIKHVGENSNFVESQCKVSSMNNIESSRVNLTALKQMTEAADKLTLHVKLSSSSETQEFDEKVLQHFECPVCKSLMKPPIYQCKFGHSFCSNCRPKLEKCPSCRALFGTTRNYSLEGLTAGVNYSCMYQHLGCEDTFHANESEKHEAMCPFKPYPCPLEDCPFKGTHSNIGKHLDEYHKDKVISSDFYKATVEFRLEQLIDFYNHLQKFYMVFDENIFRLSFKRNTDYSFWSVEVLRKKDEDAVFIYDIGIIDMRKPDRKLIRCDLCFTEINSEELFKKCILFPNNILASYACNGMFTYYCQIRKRQ